MQFLHILRLSTNKYCIIFSHSLFSFPLSKMSWVYWNVNPVVFIILNHESTASLLQTSPSNGGQAGQQNKSWPWKTLRGMQVHKHLTYWPPGLCVLQRTHGVSPQRVHFITNIDWIMSSQTDWPCPITLVRLWMKNIHLMSGLVGREGWRAHTHTHTEALALLGTGTRAWWGNRGA